jgi:hypothetical protein
MRRLLIAGALALVASSANAQISLFGYGRGSLTAGPVLMSTPLLFPGNTANNPSATAINYVPLFGGSGVNNYTAGSTTKPTVNAVAGNISNLQAYFPVDPTTASSSYDIILVIGGTKKALTCNIAAGSHSCSDTTHLVATSPGDLLGWEICPSTVGNTLTCPNATGSAVPSAQTTPIQISAVFTSTQGQESFITGGAISSNAATNAVNYSGFGAQGLWNATENLYSSVMPTGGTIDHLYVTMTAAAGSSASYDYTVFLNGVASALTCTATNPATTCTDLTHSVALVAGDTISIAACPSNTATCTAGSAPTARGANVSVRWVPTTSNLAVIFDTPTTNPGTGATAVWLNGAGAAVATATEANVPNLVPIGMTINNLRIAQCPGPGAAVTRTETLRLGTAGNASLSSQSLVAAVAAGTTACPTYSTQSATGGVSATAGQWFNWQTINSTTGGTALTTLKIGATVTIP